MNIDTSSHQSTIQSVHHQFEALTNQLGEKTALYFQDQAISYHQLDLEANRVAHALVKLGARQDTVVALLARRSPALIWGLLGILKAGAAYLPLDPAYPTERLEFMIRDSGATILLGDHVSIERLGAPPITTLLLSTPGKV